MINNLNMLGTLKSGLFFDILHAVDPATRKKYAIKIARETSIDDRKQAELLKKEWKAIKQLEHPNLLKYYHYGRKGRLPYMVMDLVDSANLKTYLRRLFPKGARDIPRKEMFVKRSWLENLIGQMVDVIQYIHENDIIHHDLKPENFLIENGENIRLIDFSNAKMGFWQKRKKPSAITGTPSFISPEQIRKEKPSELSDIYSLGATIYFVLAGTPPFTGHSRDEILKKHLTGKHQPLAGTIPGVQVGFSQLIDAMLAKNTEKRLANLAKVKYEIKRNGIFLKLK